MHIGIGTILTSYSIDILDLAPIVERFGFESIWTGDQPVLPVKTEKKIPKICMKNFSSKLKTKLSIKIFIIRAKQEKILKLKGLRLI